MAVDLDIKTLNIILSPHLDDAVISLGGFIFKNNKNTKIITIFSGKPKNKKYKIWDLICGFKNSDEAINNRIIENNKALSLLGILSKDIINLNFLDNQYLSKKEKVDRQANILRMKNYLESYIQDLDYENIKIFSPITNNHRDHNDIKNLVLSLKEENKNRNLKFFFYEDYPYFSKYKKNKEVIFKELKNKISISLNDKELNIKIKAIKEYKSQFRFLVSELIIFRNMIIKNKGKVFNYENYYLLD